jgi:hypothetical protein
VIHQGKQQRCILGDGHASDHPELQLGHELAPVDASADVVRAAGRDVGELDRVTIMVTTGGRLRVAEFKRPEKVRALLEEPGSLGSFLRLLADSKPDAGGVAVDEDA